MLSSVTLIADSGYFMVCAPPAAAARNTLQIVDSPSAVDHAATKQMLERKWRAEVAIANQLDRRSQRARRLAGSRAFCRHDARPSRRAIVGLILRAT